MKINDKTKILQRIWAWTSLAINAVLHYLIIFILLSDKSALAYGLANLFAIVILGVGNTLTLTDMSNLFLGMLYGGVLILSAMIVYETYKRTSILPSLIIVIAIVIEALIAVIIVYRYRILNKISLFLNKNRK